MFTPVEWASPLGGFMRNLWGASLVCLGLATFAAVPAKADGVLVPLIPFTDSSKTTAFSIDNNDKLVGSYVANSDGNEHGFQGTLDGNYTSFDVGVGGTEPRGANDAGWIMGFSNSLSGDPNSDPSFQRSPDGKVRFVQKKARHLKGVVQGINNSKNVFTGSYVYKNGETHGYIGQFGKWVRDIGVKTDNLGFAGRGINNSRTVAGWYLDANGVQNGLLKSGTTLTVINYPDSTEAYTVLEGINDNGQVVGQWGDTNGIVHSFILDTGSGTYTEIDDPNATQFTQAWNVNNAGVVTVSSDQGPYIWCASQDNCPSTGAPVRSPKRVVSKGFPQFHCETTCTLPVVRVRGAQPAKPKGLITQ
jgi:hypothetical protein